jgi:hypothetical protein
MRKWGLAAAAMGTAMPLGVGGINEETCDEHRAPRAPGHLEPGPVRRAFGADDDGRETTRRTPLGGVSASAGHRPGVIFAFPGCARGEREPGCHGPVRRTSGRG